ncbi:MAG: hypothetical protein J6J38_10885 [Lachnospiraceae bacterium]|nr:hypothetical protein [Lachnospiraceae bacterium]
MDLKDFIVVGIGLVLIVIGLIAKKKGKEEWKEFVIRFAGLAVIAWVVIAVVDRLG